MFDFDTPLNRRGTNCLKWDVADLFGMDRVEYPFWIADTDFATVPEVVQALKERCDHPMFGYSIPSPNCIPAVQRWYERRHNWHFEQSAAFVSIGVVTVLRASVEALTQPGDQVLIFTPVYNPFPEIIANTGRTVVDCPLAEVGNAYEIDYDLLERQLAGGVKAIIFCNPHNPIGKVWTEEELGKLADLCAKYHVYLLSDEVHGDICLRGVKYTPMGRFEQVQDLLVVYTAVSKTFNLAGLASSCIIAPNPELKDKVEKELKKSWIMAPNVMGCVAMEAAYEHGDQWLDELNEYLTKNSDFVIDYFAKYMPRVRIAKHEGTFLMWLDMRCCGEVDGDLAAVLAQECQVGLGSGASYGSQAKGYLRFNIACPMETLKKGVEGIRRFYEAHCK